MSINPDDLTDEQLREELGRLIAAVPSFVRIDFDPRTIVKEMQTAQKFDQAATDANSIDGGLRILDELMNAELRRMFNIPSEIGDDEAMHIVRNVKAALEIALILNDRQRCATVAGKNPSGQNR